MTSEPQAETRKLTEMSWDPVTRLVGSLGIHTKIDFANREVAECYSTSSIFRGYSVFMKGKDPRDAHFITSRICGICGDNHATCANYAQNMAFGVQPPPMADWIINLGEAAEYMFLTTVSIRTTWWGSTTANRWSRRRIPEFWIRRKERRRRTRASTAIADCRYHAGAQSILRIVLPGNIADEPADP